jgi:hypothetical protein
MIARRRRADPVQGSGDGSRGRGGDRIIFICEVCPCVPDAESTPRKRGQRRLMKARDCTARAG